MTDQIRKISQFTDAGTLDGAELVEVSKPSATVFITATTLSALASDQSINDSANGFLTAGFAVGMQVRITGFTGGFSANLFSGRIVALTAGKMTFPVDTGIVDDAAGESVTIRKWDTRRTTAAALAGSGTVDIAAAVHAAASKSTPVDADELALVDSAASFGLKKVTIANLRAALLSFSDALVFRGVIDCSANPNYPAADAGHTYRVSVAGKIGGASGVNVEPGDLLLCITDGTSAGTQAAVGANWNISQTNLDGAVIGPASSVNLRLAVFDGTTGKLLADGGKTLAEVAIWDAHTFYPGVPGASAIVLRIPTARAVNFPANFAGSYGRASVNATGSTVFDVQKNGSSIGSITFASGASTATFTTSGGAAQTLAAGDVLAIIAPATPDATLANVGFALAGTR